MINTKRKLGDMLIEMGQITQEELQDAIKKQRKSGKRLGQIFVEDGLITENDLLSLLEVQLGISRAYLDIIVIDDNVINFVPEALAKKYSLVPIGFHENKINVVMADPLNILAIDDVKIASGYDVEPMISTAEEINRAIDKLYSNVYVKKAAEELKNEQSVNKEENKSEENLDIDDIKNAPVVKLVDSIVDNAIRQRASDVHIEPFEDYVKVRYRIDGELQEIFRNPIATYAALSTRIKILASLNIAEKRVPQDGRFVIKIDGASVDLRVSILPTVYGEKIVIRILKKEEGIIGKDKLGLPEEELKELNDIVSHPHGVILVTGPTGSGKSTTLYALLSDLNDPKTNIITVEDPVEYAMDGVNQVNVNVKAGLTFAAGLRSILRQDPDIVMVGEIRDGETADIATRAAITGHLVLSTLHTNDAPSTVVRLVNMGVEPFLVATSVVGVISQRLVKKVCPSCKKEYDATDYEKSILGIDEYERAVLTKGNGCKSCNWTGYKGRFGVYEIMSINKEIRAAIIKGESSDVIRELAIKNGMKTLKDYTTSKVLSGETTLEELLRVAYIKE